MIATDYFRWEEHELSVFENRAVITIFGPKRGILIRDWRNLHNKSMS
jgi:hypothetical protein